MTEIDKPKKMSRVDRRKQQTREDLIDAMYHLTSQRGVEAVTIQNIVDEADIAKGSFYNYFETKEDLLDAVLLKIIEKSADTIDSIVLEFDNPIETIATAFITFDRIVTADTVLGWFIINVSLIKPTLAIELQKRFIRDVEHGIKKGIFHLPNVEMAVNLVPLAFLAFMRARLQGVAKQEDISHFILYMMRLLGADDKTSHPIITSVCKQYDL